MRDVVAWLTLVVYFLLRVLVTWVLVSLIPVSGWGSVVLLVLVVGWHGRWAVKQWSWRKGEIEKGTWDAVKGNNT